MDKTKDVLVIKCNFLFKERYYKLIYENILKQMEHGVVVLPFGVEAIVVPKDIEVRVEGSEEG